MGLLGRQTNFIGLDIGSTSIRMVQLKAGGPHPALVAYDAVPVPAGLAASDSKVDHDKISAMVAKMVKDNRITTKSVVAGLPSNKIFATVINTPKLDNAQLAKAIKYQAAQYIPMSIDQVKLDYAVLETSKDGQSLEVLLVAAPNSVVNKYVEIIENAGLEPMALEANAIAACRALVPRNNLAIAVVDLSLYDTDITIMRDNLPRLLRSVPIGSGTFVKSVAQNLGLDDVQAEQFAYKFGLTQTKLEGQVYKAIKPSLDTLVAEIQKSVKFFVDRYPDVKIEKVVVTGGASALPEIGPYLATAVGMPIEFGNAWLNVSYPTSIQDKLSVNAREFAAAVGLAERGLL